MLVSAVKEHGIFAEAEKILTSRSTPRGVDYLNGVSKRRLDMLVAGALSVGSLVPISFLAAVVLAQDRHNPFVELERYNPATLKKIQIWKIRTMTPDAPSLEE